MEILGNSIREISTQKAGIIQQKNEVIVTDQDYPEALSEIRLEAEKKNAKLTIIQSDNVFNIKQKLPLSQELNSDLFKTFKSFLKTILIIVIARSLRRSNRYIRISRWESVAIATSLKTTSRNDREI